MTSAYKLLNVLSNYAHGHNRESMEVFSYRWKNERDQDNKKSVMLKRLFLQELMCKSFVYKDLWRRGDSNPRQAIFVSPLFTDIYNLSSYFKAT